MNLATLILAALCIAYTLVRAEFDKYELRKQLAKAVTERDELIECIHRRTPKAEIVDRDDLPDDVQRQIAQRGRAGRFQSFGSAKRKLESQEPPQRSVTV